MKLGHIASFAWAATLAIGLVAGGTVACSSEPPPKMATVKAADMPEGESWDGVYFHPVFGYLHLLDNGTSVEGKWKRSDQSKWGEITGTKVGNVVHFAWKEHTYGLVGPAAETHGKGVFVYGVEEVNGHKTGKLAGQFGMMEDEVGSTWDCTKQVGMKPKPDTITGDQSATGAPAAAGRWDEK